MTEPTGPRPRVHNVTSYAVALAVFVAVTFFRARTLAVTVPLGLWALHFARRTLESLFLHRYGKRAVPWSDALVEYVYYWGFAAWIAWATARGPEAVTTTTLAGIAVFAIGEIGNATTHVMLARLRPKGTNVRKIPRGFLFGAVSSPNYLFEIVSWIGYALATWTLGAAVFAVVGAGILADWANKRHRAYLAEFDGKEGRESYPTSRRRLVPFVF